MEYDVFWIALTEGLDYGGLRKRVAKQMGLHNSRPALTLTP